MKETEMRKYLALTLTLPIVMAFVLVGQDAPFQAWLDLAKGELTPTYCKPTADELKVLQARVLADLMAKPIPTAN